MVAVVTAGILLIVAMSIGGIALKEQVLSIASRESQVAFYAADTGMECALYLDQKIGAFATDFLGNPSGSPSGSCNSNGQSLAFYPISNVQTAVNPGDRAQFGYTFEVDRIPVGDSGNVYTCAIVTVIKDTNDAAAYPNYQGNMNNSSKTHTRIDSRGYNTCGSSLNRLERGIVSNN